MATRPSAARRSGRCTPKPATAQPRNGGGVAVRWCATEADLPAARRATRDQLVGPIGTHRDVTWVEVTGLYALRALDLTAAAASYDSQDLTDYYRGLRARLQDRGGWLVIAALGTPI
jgi:hypothetical protein